MAKRNPTTHWQLSALVDDNTAAKMKAALVPQPKIDPKMAMLLGRAVKIHSEAGNLGLCKQANQIFRDLRSGVEECRL